MPDVLSVVRAEALFASTLQGSEAPAANEVRLAVAGTLARLGKTGCAARVAGEFGDHPEAAVARMRWALGAVTAAYSRRWAARRPERALVLARVAA